MTVRWLASLILTSNLSLGRWGELEEQARRVLVEVSYMDLDRRGAELLFHVLTEREENNSIAIASNELFSGWTKRCTDPRPCAAIIDRLTVNGTIIETGTDSYRLAHTQKQRAGTVTTRV
jgi:DNA replication protein DnaC